MATYDLEQQEQLDQVKQFWKQYGNLITWVLVLALGAYAAWTGYLYWQQQRAQGAGGLYEALDRAASTDDAAKVAQAFSDLRDKFAGTTFSEQGALLAAKVAVDHHQRDAALADLHWLVDHGKNANLVAIGRLRLAGVLMDGKQYDEALTALEAKLPPEYAPLVDDRRGDILMAQGNTKEAIQAYQSAWQQMPASLEYRRFIEGKLTALGHAPTPAWGGSGPAEAAASGAQP